MELTILALWVAFTWAGYKIGEPKGRATAGGWLGFLFGIIGIIIIFLMPPKNEAK